MSFLVKMAMPRNSPYYRRWQTRLKPVICTWLIAIFASWNFCSPFAKKSAFFIVRQHGCTPYKQLTQLKFVGKSATGDIFEQTVAIPAPMGETLEIRRVVVPLNKPTRNGDPQLILLTNLPQETVDAVNGSRTLFAPGGELKRLFKSWSVI